MVTKDPIAITMTLSLLHQKTKTTTAAAAKEKKKMMMKEIPEAQKPSSLLPDILNTRQAPAFYQRMRVAMHCEVHVAALHVRGLLELVCRPGINWNLKQW